MRIMFINKLMGDKDLEEKSILTSEEFEDDACCVCSKTMQLDEKEVFCIGCANICHLACLETDSTGSVVELKDGQIKTFKCLKCNTRRNVQINQDKYQVNVPIPTFNKRFQRKRDERGPTRDRKCTDVSAFLFLFLVITVFISVIVSLGGVDVFLNGSDSCGNICGKVNNYPSESLRHNHGCMGADHSDKKLVLFVDYIESLGDISSSPRECVSTCPMNMVQIMNYCMHFGSPTPSAPTEVNQGTNFSFNNNDSSEKVITQESKFFPLGLDTDLPLIKGLLLESSFGDFLKDLFRLKAMEWFTIERITKLWFLAVGMSCIVVIIFCCLPTYGVWLVPMTMALILLIGTSCFMKVVWAKGIYWMVGSLPLTILAGLLLILQQYKKHKFKLIRSQNKFIAGLYKEAGQLLAAVPCLLLFSLLTMFYVSIIVGLWFRGALLIEGANVIYSSYNHYGSTLQIIARCLWIGLAIWAIEFMLNCQRMIFAGTAAHWNHAKDKRKVSYSIVCRSCVNLIRYHLGTLVYGSLIFQPITALKYITKPICCRARWTKRDGCKIFHLLFEFILRFVPDFLICWYNITSSQTFNQTAMHGKSYCESENKALDLKADHCVESFHLLKFSLTFPTMSFYVITSTTLLSIYLFGWTEEYGPVDLRNENFLVVFMAIILVALLTGHFFLSAYQLIVDELYICYLEDVDTYTEVKAEFILLLNKQNCAQKALGEVDKKENLTPTSTGSTSTLSITDEPATFLTKSSDVTSSAKEIKV